MSNILFVCSANKQRSKTAEDYFSEEYLEHSFKSARNQSKNMFSGRHQLHCRDGFDLGRFCFGNGRNSQEVHHQKIWRPLQLQDNGVNIRGYYSYYQEELINILEEKMKRIF